jgi:hypothetical protein
VLTAYGVAVVATGVVVVGTLKDHVAQLTTTCHLAKMQGLDLLLHEFQSCGSRRRELVGSTKAVGLREAKVLRDSWTRIHHSSKSVYSHSNNKYVKITTPPANDLMTSSIKPWRNQALVSQLKQSSNQVQGIEKTAIELAQLGQLLSTAISSQALAIEAIYENALEASAYVAAGNEHLKKAIKLNRSFQRYIIVLVLVATASLLFFDWFNS